MFDQKYFLDKAEENMPKLYSREIRPEPSVHEVRVYRGDELLLDLGEHAVGTFSFKFDNIDDFIAAPTKFIVRFAEDMREVEDDFSAYKGTLSPVWLQEETVIADFPGTVTLPRRYSCRYVKITTANTRRFIKLFDFCFTATTSADEAAIKPASIADPMMKRIDEVAAATLRDCMQTFFEDGPKRDRRLWIGDLRLEALTNYYTFDARDIVKRCLYLFAAGDTNALGFLPSYIYETPYFFSGRDNIADYALLYVVSVCDYFEHTGDRAVLDDLLPVCRAQLESFRRILDERGIVKPQTGWFSFIDWCPGLKALTALMGVYLYTLERFEKLLSAIGAADASDYAEHLSAVREAVRRELYSAEERAFVNALDEHQKSVHSQVWMILGGAIEGDEGRELLERYLADGEAKQPFTPYMRHYVTEAMIKLGMKDEAIAYIRKYWGGMVELGADTFFEVYVPEDPDFSPYKDRMINSLCHAWSCTPAYFIRKYGL